MADFQRSEEFEADGRPAGEATPRSGRGWPIAVGVLLGMNVVICLSTAYFALSNGGAAVEPDYYQKSLNWTTHAAAMEASRKLGWTTSPSCVPGTTPGQPHTLRITLASRGGTPLDGAKVTFETFPQARANERQTGEMKSLGAGVYEAAIGVAPRAGLWELRVSASRGPDLFRSIESVDVPSVRSTVAGKGGGT